MNNMQKFRGGRGNRRFNQNQGERFHKYRDYDDPEEREDKADSGFQFNNRDKTRRVSFKPTGRQINRKRFSNETIRTILEEDDDMANAGTSQHRGDNRNSLPVRRRGSPIPRRRGGFNGNAAGKGRGKLVTSQSGWYQVTIPYGQKYSKEVILKRLLDHIHPDIFVPHYYRVDADRCCFFVDEYETAQKLYNKPRVQMSSGQALFMKIFPSVPNGTVDKNLKERMKNAMAKRYNSQTRCLDLTRFHADADFSDIFVGLFRVSIMGAALDVIAENVPEIETLILTDNKIVNLTHFDTLARNCPNLRNLCLRNNRVTTSNTLENLKSLPLVELVLDGNPIKESLAHQYISEVRKRTPKLQILDGEALPPQIGFDVSSDEKLMPAKSSFLCDTNGETIVRQFLEQYFILFDSDNRQPLLDAYHEHATFSLTSYAPNDDIPERGLKPYGFSNRNLLARPGARGPNTRNVKNGRLPVVSYLSELPPTQHDLQSFGVDLSLFLPQMILLTITGIFREKRKNQSQPLRSFQKSLLIVPSGSGFCIRNEMLHITDVTKHQTIGAFKPPRDVTDAPGLMQPPPPHVAPQVAPIVPVTPVQAMPSTSGQHFDDVTKMQMVQTMAQKSTMNLDWSRKCLEETNWDFEKAAFVFSELHKQNKIPPEAFIK
ncbi:Nuclear RNA export factor 1 [Sergentomyia squamirostris]